MFSKNKNKKIKKRILASHPVQAQKMIMAKNRHSHSQPKSGFWSRFLFYFLLITFFLTLGYLILFSGLLIISKVEIIGNNQVEKEDLEKIIQADISGKYFNLIEKNNLALFNSRKFEKEVKNKFRIIEGVEIKKKFPDILTVALQERTVSLILNSSGKNWVVDEKGTVFDEAWGDLTYLGKADICILSDASGKNFSLGDTPLDEDYLKFIFDFRKDVQDSLEISFSKEMETPGIFSGDTRMKTTDGWEILLDKDLGADKEAEMLQVVLDNKIEKEKWADLEYVDLRTANKVFYKFKNSEATASEDGQGEEQKIEASGEASTSENKKKK